MAYEQRAISQSLSSDANFRTWGSTTSDLWQDVGLTKTADTGQIDWTSVVRGATADTFLGYEIFTLDTDTQHATFPLYIRVDYGVGSGAVDRAKLGIQIGSGTNGAGTLTGVLGTQRIFTASAADTTTRDNYCSAGDGYFAWAGGWEAASNTTSQLRNTIFIIERLRDNTGDPTADGVYTFFAGIEATFGTRGYTQITRSTDTITAYSSGAGNIRIGSYVPNQSGSFGSDLYLFTHHPADRALYNPCLSNLFYYHSDFTAGVDFDIDMYGTAQTYKPLGRNNTASNSFQNTAFAHTNSGLALLWE